VLVVVDLHNEDRRDELDPKWQEAFVRFWGLLAERLSRFDPDLTILEIINEPVFKLDVHVDHLGELLHRHFPQRGIAVDRGRLT
jgi:hypothetical protein